MITLALFALALAIFLAGGAIIWPLAHRAGMRAERRDQAEIARILGAVDAPPRVREPIDWGRPALRAPTASHASLRVATTPATYQPRHTGALVLAHLAAADTYIGRPRQLVSS